MLPSRWPLSGWHGGRPDRRSGMARLSAALTSLVIRLPALILLVAAVLLGMAGPGDGARPAAAADANPAGGFPHAPLIRFSWPMPPPHPVLRPFEPPSGPYGPGHRGVDLGGSVGEPVLAAGDGLVLYAGPLADRSLVSVEHADGLRTTYEPVNPTVRVGQYVRRGELIGHLLPGHPGCPAGNLPGPGLPPAPGSPAPPGLPQAPGLGPMPGSGPASPMVCLHWGVHRGRVYLDPLRLVETGRIRLLPWPPGEP